MRKLLDKLIDVGIWVSYTIYQRSLRKLRGEQENI